MWNNYGGCGNDRGWFVVIDVGHGSGACQFELNLQNEPLPVFLYSKSNIMVGENGKYQLVTLLIYLPSLYSNVNVSS